MKKIIHYFIIFILGLLLFGCGSSGNASDDAASKNDTTKNDTTELAGKSDEKKKGEEKIILIPVEVTSINRGSISSYILLSSNLETEKMADVYSRVQGLVEKIHVEEGDYVQKGQLLMELEADEYELSEERARVGYQEQKNAFDRAQEMFK